MDSREQITEASLTERRYKILTERSLFPPWTLLRESFKEDPKVLLPRMILMSMRTARWIPTSLLMGRGEARDALVYRLLKSWARRMCRLA